MKANLSNWEIVRHGIEYPDYFQGCGTAFTDYKHVQTGIGAYEQEALFDALDSMSMMFDWDDDSLSEIVNEDISSNKYTTLDYLKDNLPADCDIENADSAWYYVSIRFNVTFTK